MKNNLARRSKQQSPDSLDLTKLILSATAEVKAMEAVALDLRKVSDIADYFVIASGKSDRQVQGIANRVIESAAEQGLEPISIEGFETGHWILIDFGDVVTHVFYEPVRQHYDLENLWWKAERV